MNVTFDVANVYKMVEFDDKNLCIEPTSWVRYQLAAALITQ